MFIARGNLQYDAKTLKWTFAEPPVSYVGFNNGVLDLFGWGTGNDPMNMSLNSSDYKYLKEANELQGIRFYDWGMNVIYDAGMEKFRQ